MNDDDDEWSSRAIMVYGAPPPPRFARPSVPDYVDLAISGALDNAALQRREAAVAERERIVADLRSIADDVTNPTNKLALLMVAMWIEHE